MIRLQRAWINANEPASAPPLSPEQARALAPTSRHASTIPPRLWDKIDQLLLAFGPVGVVDLPLGPALSARAYATTRHPGCAVSVSLSADACAFTLSPAGPLDERYGLDKGYDVAFFEVLVDACLEPLVEGDRAEASAHREASARHVLYVLEEQDPEMLAEVYGLGRFHGSLDRAYRAWRKAGAPVDPAHPAAAALVGSFASLSSTALAARDLTDDPAPLDLAVAALRAHVIHPAPLVALTP